MMRQYELVERVMAYDPEANETLLNRAYVYAMKAHGTQVRASGDPYFSHPLEVAAILTELKLDDATIIAALLHDVIEDTSATHQEIEELFGSDIAGLVEGLTKIKRLDLVTREAAQAENLRKLLVAVSKDIRVLLVKLADRLHNMRTLHHMAPDSRQRIAQETIDIYAPLAGRMGMQTMRDELEDQAFRVLNPEAHKTISERLTRLRQESGEAIAEIEKALKDKLAANHIGTDVFGREKRPYSIWRKMERKHLSLGQLSDIFGFRVIVATLDECYRALGIAHYAWRAVPGRFKDYISNPKQNGYRSLHTTVIGPRHMRVELQIRTREMHEVAERGIAAHGFYKDAPSVADAGRGVQVDDPESQAYQWLRHLIDILSEGDNPKEFLEHTRLELFHDQVFCFTPKGSLIALPRGANAIDFAYAVHTDIGNSCVGCRINGSHAPLMSELENGDEVEIIRSRAQVPPAAWEGLAVTGKARAAIRRATRMAIRKQYAGLGRAILERALAKHDRAFTDKELAAGVSRLGFKDPEDALAALGRGELAGNDVLSAMGLQVVDAKLAPGETKRPLAKRGERAIRVRGLNRDLPIRFAPETGAVPGERIVGILTPGEGITVYPIFARGLQRFDDEPDRWVDLTWDTLDDGQLYPARVKVVIHNEVGALAQVTGAIGENGGNIDNLQMATRAKDFYDLDIVLEVHDVKHLNRIMQDLRMKPLVSSIVRMTG
ncbi:MAG TPA: bifunctional (p)ppGpp synthetase/guanosine-3',5'-bis(diphosphate) 3'-pyrophosphohydrolase [Aestuariivirgaceae bacterium]|nr:bifunctional (p)ppGpp synthetase/guanosine-3',5'-bis(diphosphate) 3'-pyrophosphohydrolase [Aestuariivirgaceae bacterium]